MKKLIFILTIFLTINVNSQPLISKQYLQEGSVWCINYIGYDFLANKTLIRIAVYTDGISMLKNKSKPVNIHDFNFPGILIDPSDSAINWVIHNHTEIFAGAEKISVQKLPAPPDTTWVVVSDITVNSTLYGRKIGVYKAADDFQGKSCYIEGIAKHYRNDTLVPKYTQMVSWTLDNSDSVWLGSSWFRSYNAIKYLQGAYGWSDTETIIHGVQFFDPGKINDRLKY